jgi:hypothetical protein
MTRGSSVSRQNARGEWVPDTPVPFYEKLPLRQPRYVCQCGEKFRSEHRYNEHYLVAHIREHW